MAGKNTAVYGIYHDKLHVEEAIDRMIADGFRREDISVLLSDERSTKDFAHEKNTKAPEGTTTGALAGGAVGGTLGFLAGIGTLAVPGLGPLLAAGPIVAALAGVGAGGAVGGLIGALVGLGIPEYEAKRYEGRIRRGGILVSVHCDDSAWISRAKHALEQTGAEDISSAGEAKADFGATEKPRLRTRASHSTESGRETVLRDEEPLRMAAGSSGAVSSSYEDDFRRDFESRYQGRGLPYDQYEPAYRLGSGWALDERYRALDWSAVEPEIRRSWEVRGRLPWEDAQDAIRYGWERTRRRV